MVFRGLAGSCALFLAIAPAPIRSSRAASCRTAELGFTPVAGLQIAVWIEDAGGDFVDTVYVTRTTGSYGLGNRPGRPDFDSEVLWPYGRREMVLPIWAHRRGVVYPQVVFQDGDENDLSHTVSHSSIEDYYCRPLAQGERAWEDTIDAGSCATTAFTDKGRLSASLTSFYPPRADLGDVTIGDSNDMLAFASLNDLDAVSRATPPGGEPFSLVWPVPADLPDGDYLAWIEVSREGDFNASYDPGSYPSPEGLAWAQYGFPSRGQPSVVYRLPFVISAGAPSRAAVAEYAGYGDPDGLDGLVSPPDPSIDTVAGTYQVLSGKGAPRSVESFGAARLLLESGAAGPSRFRIEVRVDEDAAPPGRPGELELVRVEADLADLVVVVPGDDAAVGRAAEYEVRTGVGEAPVDEAGFTAGRRVPGPEPLAAGEALDLSLVGLAAETVHWVGFRAIDDCGNTGPFVVTSFTTAAGESGTVDACFVATAAWGSLFSSQVGMLRRFRDGILRRQVLGEIFVQAYYTFGPAGAELIRPSETLRRLARAALSPVAGLARSATPLPGDVTAHED